MRCINGATPERTTDKRARTTGTLCSTFVTTKHQANLLLASLIADRSCAVVFDTCITMFVFTQTNFSMCVEKNTWVVGSPRKVWRRHNYHGVRASQLALEKRTRSMVCRYASPSQANPTLTYPEIDVHGVCGYWDSIQYDEFSTQTLENYPQTANSFT